jgi:fatty-acyl-CoA synthase/long-chain acyl-CoA synthetase
LEPAEHLKLPLITVPAAVDSGVTGGLPAQRRATESSVGPEPALSDPAAVFRTSGTSGPPHSVVHTHRSLMSSVETLEALRSEFFKGSAAKRLLRLTTSVVQHRGRLLQSLGSQVWMTPMSPHTISGFRILLQALLSGHRLAVSDRFRPSATLELIQNEHVSIFAASPTMLEAMLRVPNFDRYDLSSLAVIGLGSAPTSPLLVGEAGRRFGCPILVGYGSTETGGGLMVTRIFDRESLRASTVGRAFPGAAVKIVDESRRVVPPGTAGEIAGRSTGLMAGYLSASPADRGGLSEDGWYYTGDLGVMDSRGYVRVLGRKSDVIIRGGHKVLPQEVEAVLESHPAVARAAVVGVPKEPFGEVTWAFVVRRAREAVRGGELRQYCAERLTIHKVPDHVRFVEALPAAASGEVKRHELRDSIMVELRGERGGIDGRDGRGTRGEESIV